MDENVNTGDQSVTIEIPETPAQEVTPPVEPITDETAMDTAAKQARETDKQLAKPQIVRNEKGQIVKAVAQDTNKNGTAGAPCKYCKDKENKQKIVDDYIKLHQESVKGTIPWIEELALLLDVDDETLTNWANKKD